MRLVLSALPLAALFALGGCQEPAPDPGGDPVPVDPEFVPPTFACDPAAAPVATPLRRLSRAQYVNSVNALADGFEADLAERLRDAVLDPLARIPADAGPHTRLDDVVADDHVAAWYAVGEAFAGAVTQDRYGLQAALGDCAVDRDTSNDAACLQAFVEDFGGRAWRRPLRAAERDFLLDTVHGPGSLDADGVTDVISVLLSAAPMLYHVEDGGEPVADRPDLQQLTAHELANRLAYHFWQAPPDDALRALADRGTLLDDDVYAAELDRVARDPRATASVHALFDGWLHLSELEGFDGRLEDPRYVAFAGEDLPAPGLRERMLDDAYALVDYEMARQGTLDDVFLSTAVVTPDADVAALYESYPWDGASEPDRAPERVGLLSRPALVANESHQTAPIHKGVRIRKHLLCDEVGAPPADLGELPEVDEIATRRTQTAQLTERDGTSCLGCHQYTNPLGYATEDFDALGRFRTEEAIFSEDGALLASLPVDTRAAYAVPKTDPTVGSGVGDLSRQLLASGQPQACLARIAVRHATHRLEDEVADGCWLESIRQDLVAGRPLMESLRDVAARPEFRLKVTE